MRNITNIIIIVFCIIAISGCLGDTMQVIVICFVGWVLLEELAKEIMKKKKRGRTK